MQRGDGPLLPANGGDGEAKPALRQRDRRIDWQRDDTHTVLAKIRAADGQPGVRDDYAGATVYLHDAAPAPGVVGNAGDWIGHAGESLARATRDGALWLGHLQIIDAESERRIKLPAVTAVRKLGQIGRAHV